MTRPVFVLLVLGLLLLSPAGPVRGEATVRERATEEIAPGIRVRGGSVIIEVDPDHCDPACGDGRRCEEVCRIGECDARSTADNPCRHCVWQCVE